MLLPGAGLEGNRHPAGFRRIGQGGEIVREGIVFRIGAVRRNVIGKIGDINRMDMKGCEMIWLKCFSCAMVTVADRAQIVALCGFVRHIFPFGRKADYRFATVEGSKTKYVWKGRINVQPLYYQSELWALCTNGFRGLKDRRYIP